MDNEFNEKMLRYLMQVAEQNPSYLQAAMTWVMMMQVTVRLMNIFTTQVDTLFKQLEDELRKLMDREEDDDR